MSCELLTISSSVHDMTQLLSLMFFGCFPFSVVAFERTSNVHQLWWEMNLTRSLPQTALLITKLIHKTVDNTHTTSQRSPNRTICREHNWHWRPIMLYGFYCAYWRFRKIIIIISTRIIHRDYFPVCLYVLISML